jgi:lipid-A-disaccharide synthase
MSELPAQAGPSASQRLFLVAGEESGDRLGAALMRALKRRLGHRVQFSGIGGNAMQGEGLASLFPLDDVTIFGFAAIPRKIPRLLRRIRAAAAAAVSEQPDVVVIIDSPDFTHRVARRIRAAAPAIPIVDYVAPSVWAWRPGRARKMRAYVDHVLALLPFEPAAFARLGGPPCTYVGHPLIERLSEWRPDAAEQRRRMADPPLLLVLPGSRASELRHMMPVFRDVLAQIAAKRPLDIVLPTLPRLAAQVRAAAKDWPVMPRIVADEAEKHAAFRSARAAVAKSGTVTLELALAGVPMAAAYKLSALEAAVFRRLIRIDTVILANLVLGEKIVPEFIQEACTADRIAAAVLPLLDDSPQRRRQLDAFARLDEVMGVGGPAPSERAAEAVLATASPRRAAPGNGGYLRREIGT